MRASLVVGRLLEADGLEFYNVLRQSEGSLTISGGGKGPDDTAIGQLEIWWGMEIEARSWGIKDMSPFIQKFVLDGWFEDGAGRDTGELFHYDYPETKIHTEIGPDPDAPTPDNVVRLATPKWTVEYSIDRFRSARTLFTPSAEVDLSTRTIEIQF